MTNLSDPANISGNTPINTPPGVSGSWGNKEIVGGSDNQDIVRDSTGTEHDVPKEVSSAGVQVKPTVIPIPQSVAQMGVKPVGQNIPVQTMTTVTLPLTDDQIAAGLSQGITNSWRWLAEWCVRRLKQIHIAVKTVGGTLIRTKI